MDTIATPDAEASVEIAGSPSAVWAVVSDVTRTPEWSPVCHRCTWVDDASRPEVGSHFRGYNKLNGFRWSRECVVTEAVPGERFGFSTLFRGQESTRWRYTIEDLGGGRARVAESYEIVSVPPWLGVLRRLPGVTAKGERDTAWNLETSLERLKAVVERSPA